MAEGILFGINWISLIIFIVIWVIFITLIIISNIYTEPEIHQIFDKCSESDVKFRYFVRIAVNPSTRHKFNINKTSLTIRIRDSNKVYISSFSVKMSLLKSFPNYQYLNRVDIKLIVNRCEKWRKWGFIEYEAYKVISLYFYVTEMIAIDTKDHYLMVSESDVTFNGLSHSSDPIVCQPLMWNLNRADRKPSKFLLINEVLVFLYMNINWVLLFATVGFAFHPMVLLIYRFVVKYYYWRSFGSRFWNRISIIYLVTIFSLGITFGILFLVWSHLYSYPKSIGDVWPLLLSLFILIFVCLLLIFLSYVMKCNIFGEIHTKNTSKVQKTPKKLTQ